ncbi:MAG: hypothetical protein LBQ27_05585 [Clostridiales bacterium]|jgi:sporulation integral membrane protein YlbJ|nr:hypothetical protein [Clostridiales bacterium]
MAKPLKNSANNFLFRPSAQLSIKPAHLMRGSVENTSFASSLSVKTDGRVKKKLSPIFLSLFAVAASLALVLKPEIYAASFLDGLKLFASSVLPSLFPFLVLGKLFIASGGLGGVSNGFGKIFVKLFNVPKESGGIFLTALISGYPVGAKLVAEMHSKGALNADEAAATTAFTSLSGPLFIIGVIGGALLKNPKAAAIILLCHYASAITAGLCFKNKKKTDRARIESIQKPAALSDNIFGETISSAVSTVLLVGGLVALFNMLCDMALNGGILSLPAGLLTKITGDQNASAGILLSFIEMTRGVKELSASGDINFCLPLIAAAVTFGGLSVTVQCLAYLKPVGVSAAKYLKIKAVQSFFAWFFATVTIFLFKPFA